MPFTQEVVCVSEALQDYAPQTDVAIELGGEDAKIIYFTNGIEQRMNGVCAGGTGSFIDQMATLLQTDASGLNDYAKDYDTIYPIAARCGVFAKTDIQPLINEGATKPNLAASIFQAVVNQTISGLACGKPIKGNVAFLGGPLHFLPELKNAFIRTLNLTGDAIIDPGHSHLFAAVGAAMNSKPEVSMTLSELIHALSQELNLIKLGECRGLGWCMGASLDCCFMYSAATTVKVGKTMFSERLREARKAKHYSQAEVSRLLGVTQQAVGKWETGRSTPAPQTVARLAEILDTTADMLLGLQSNADAHGAVGQRAFSQYTQCPIPVVGTVRAGYDALAFEEDYGTEYASVKDPQNYFYLVVKGDSMEPRISDGDLALIHRQNTLDNGDLGVMVYGDGNGTLKKYIQRGNAVVLHPFNPDYEDLIIRGEELDHLYIAGKVVETKAKW